MVKRDGSQLGSWAFLVGIIIALLIGIVPNALNSTAWLVALVVIGLIVGLLNITDSEVTPFLMSGVVLIIASQFGGDALSQVRYLQPIFNALLILFVPATIVVAIKNVFSLARR